MTALFKPIKRILSPRESDRSRGNEDDAPVPGTTTNSDMDSMIVDNVIYSEPTQLDRVAPRRGSGSGSEDPPLPPRPQSAGGDSETYYQAPIDTLGRGNTDQQQQQQQQRAASTRDRERLQERETRLMVLHNKTLSQKAQQCAPITGNGASGSVVAGHRRTRSGGHVIDNEEYSTPWNVQEQQRRSSGAPPKAPRTKKSGAGKPIPATPSDGSDNIIPVSPSSILPHHERSQSASPIPPRSPGLGSSEPEYDDPWDVKNKKINKAIPNQHGRHHGHSVHERRSPPPSQLAGETRPLRMTVGGRIEHSKHLEEVRPSRAMSEKNHNWSSGGMDGTEPFRPRTITDVHSSGVSVSTPSSPRTSSLSMPPHHIQRRPLPEEPSNSSCSTSIPSPSSIPLRREPSPASSTWFDCQLALEEQP